MGGFYWIEIIPQLKINLHTDGGKNEKTEPGSGTDGFTDQLNHSSKRSFPNILFSEGSTFLKRSKHYWSVISFSLSLKTIFKPPCHRPCHRRCGHLFRLFKKPGGRQYSFSQTQNNLTWSNCYLKTTLISHGKVGDPRGRYTE